jgi:hypothetical protein
MKPGSQLARAALLLPLLLGLGQGAEFRKFKTNVPAEVSAALHALLLQMQLLLAATSLLSGGFSGIVPVSR